MPRGRAPAAGPSARARGLKATPAARRPSRRRRASAARGTAGCRPSARRTSAQTRTRPAGTPSASASASFAPSGPRSIVSSGLPCTDARHAAVSGSPATREVSASTAGSGSDRARQRGHVIERHLVRPMQILDRSASTGDAAQAASSETHDRAARPCCRAALSIASYNAPRPSACGRPMMSRRKGSSFASSGCRAKHCRERLVPRRVVRSRRQIHQAGGDFADHFAPFGHAEVEHEPGMAGEPAASARLRNSPTSRDLPMPASPRTNTVPPVPPAAQLARVAASCASSATRPTKGYAPDALAGVDQLDETPRGQRRVDAFHLRVLDRRASRDALRGRVHGFVEHGLARRRRASAAAPRD